MTHIPFIDEKDAEEPLAAVYQEWRRANPSREKIPGILQCFARRPDFLKQVIEFSKTIHFTEGHLTVRVKEMIATLVSGLNRCPYCLGSHAYFLQVQGVEVPVIEALGRGDIPGAALPENERVLLEFAQLVTGHAYRSTPQDVERLQALGWTHDQISEAVYITALFAFFNRVANAFGLQDPGYAGGFGRLVSSPPVGGGPAGSGSTGE